MDPKTVMKSDFSVLNNIIYTKNQLIYIGYVAKLIPSSTAHPFSVFSLATVIPRRTWQWTSQVIGVFDKIAGEKNGVVYFAMLCYVAFLFWISNFRGDFVNC